MATRVTIVNHGPEVITATAMDGNNPMEKLTLKPGSSDSLFVHISQIIIIEHIYVHE